MQTMVATGKARGPWIHDVIPKLPAMPGVYMQGLLIHEANGSIMHEKWLESDIVAECIDIAERHKLTLAAYCGERIVTESTNEHTDRLMFYREPTPEGAPRVKACLPCHSSSTMASATATATPH
jgi:hydroxymethylpyrimidine pyrophosphatase-like HAD family hydrolase